MISRGCLRQGCKQVQSSQAVEARPCHVSDCCVCCAFILPLLSVCHYMERFQLILTTVMQVHIMDRSNPVYFQSNLPVQNLLVWKNAELELWKVRFMFRNTVAFRGHLHFLQKNVNKEKVQAVFNLWRVKWVQCLHTIQ